MQGQNEFKQAVENYLNNRAATDNDLAAKMKNAKKNIDGCVAYILGEVSRSGRSYYDDDEIFGLAVHYYDEQEVKTRPSRVRKAVTPARALTAEQRKQSDDELEKRAAEVKSKPWIAKKPEPKPQPKPKKANEGQLSLFDF